MTEATWQQRVDKAFGSQLAVVKETDPGKSTNAQGRDEIWFFRTFFTPLWLPGGPSGKELL